MRPARTKFTRFLGVAALSFTVFACGPAHIAPFNPRDREYDEGSYAQKQEQAKPATGSIYSEAVAGYLEDTRAVRIGDIVLIRINEHADAKGGATTALSHEAERQDNITSLLGLLPALQRAHPDMDTEQLITLMSNADFKGDGQTSRAGELTGTVAVRVKKEMPNGDLFIEGTKVVMINNEEYHLYVSGLVRPSDIERDNSVQSSLIADAEVEFTGRGDIATTVERGWLTQFLDWVNPF
jgi:flagellar L-ring protein FlgH